MNISECFPFTPRGVVFDCDGVMIDSRSANIGYYNLLMDVLGKPHLTPEQEDYAQMATAYQAVAQVMTPEELAHLPELSKKYPYKENVLPSLTLEPYFEEFARWLKARGIALGIHTNRSSGIWDVLDRFGFRDLFDTVMHVPVALPKPDPDGINRIVWEWGFDPSEVIMVGDSDTDMGAARDAAVPFVAYKNTGLEAFWHAPSFSAFQTALEGAFARSAVR